MGDLCCVYNMFCLKEQSAKEAAATAKKESFAANFKGSWEELAACELAGATNAAVANAKKVP